MLTTVTAVVVGGSDGVSTAIARSLDVPVASFDAAMPPHPAGVVIVIGTTPGPEPADLAATADTDWHRLTEAPMRRTLGTLQRARAAMLGGSGRIVLVVPTIGMTGAARLVPYATALEGVRSMAKSAARQWASDGIAVNQVAAPLRLFAPDSEALAAHLTTPATSDDDALVHTVVETTRFLLRPDVDQLVGATILADGGSVMLP